MIYPNGEPYRPPRQMQPLGSPRVVAAPAPSVAQRNLDFFGQYLNMGFTMEMYAFVRASTLLRMHGLTIFRLQKSIRELNIDVASQDLAQQNALVDALVAIKAQLELERNIQPAVLAQPAVQPAVQPAAHPAMQPAPQPAAQPAAQPAEQPAAQPDDSAKECVVCLSEQIQTVIVPCGHMCLCLECSEQLTPKKNNPTKCPICRTAIMQIIQTFSVH